MGREKEQGGSGGRGRQFSLIWANPLPAKRSQNLTKEKIPSPAHVSPEQPFLQLHGHGESCGQPWGEATQEQGNHPTEPVVAAGWRAAAHISAAPRAQPPFGHLHSQPAARVCSPLHWEGTSRCEAPAAQTGTAPWRSTASFSAPSSLGWEAEPGETPSTHPRVRGRRWVCELRPQQNGHSWEPRAARTPC